MKYLMECIHQNDGVPRVVIIGDSNAHSLCRGITEQSRHEHVLSDTGKVTRLARKLESKPNTHLVWVGPVYISRSYMLLALRLHADQVALWRQAILPPNVHVVDPWALTEPLNEKQSRDGLHYQTFLDRGGRNVEDAYQITGPAIIYTLKFITSSLMNRNIISTKSSF